MDMTRFLLVCSSFLLFACQSTDSIGVLNTEQFIRDNEQFRPQPAHSDQHKTALTNALRQHGPVHLVIYFGAWCHDSERELPRLLALLQDVPPALLSYELYGLDHHKSDPANRARAHRITRTPTVVVEADNAEIGRIVEQPQKNWAEDLSAVLKQRLALQN
ncbi:hypothetical protein [Permianibacter aggregans]|uniref:Thioredoxin n=1 Tax=Permianibacter aggregans TaxID=1510150 RepID=A0A4R6UJS5_9GAMM|nr:hypothetical protein [Permianibacter aggregans]QGX38971.1 hypothetical protein E2H98_04565 [Permianibacter aggregans]TDQ46782.1 hypothetical protein EV696_11237 [Permianibacter aggregans]